MRDPLRTKEQARARRHLWTVQAKEQGVGYEAIDHPVRIQSEDFSVEEEVHLLHGGDGRIGGVVAFLGTARDFSQGKDVSQLEFEEYADMARKSMHVLRDQAMKRFDIIDVRMVHRVGMIRAGEQIVLIIVGAVHRAAAFDACEWCIDTLKETVPIWKKEITPGGESWVEEHP